MNSLKIGNMGKKHLSEDKIKYVVSADSSEAQEEIHDLIKATKELKKEERERRKAMIELEAQGKRVQRSIRI